MPIDIVLYKRYKISVIIICFSLIIQLITVYLIFFKHKLIFSDQDLYLFKIFIQFGIYFFLCPYSIKTGYHFRQSVLTALCPLFMWIHGGILIKDLRINEEIRAKQVRLIDENGNQVGIVDYNEALDMAYDRKLDLVLMSPKAKPPVTRIMDYGKFKYDQEKKEKENRKKQKNAQLKETRFSLNIEDNDLQTKANQSKKFLNNGDKVKVSIRFRGRELGRKEPGYELMEKFKTMLGDSYKVTKKPKMEGRSLVMFLEPNDEKGE